MSNLQVCLKDSRGLFPLQHYNGRKLSSGQQSEGKKRWNLHDDEDINGVIVFTEGTWNEAIIVRVDNWGVQNTVNLYNTNHTTTEEIKMTIWIFYSSNHWGSTTIISIMAESAGIQNFRVETVYLDETTLLVKLIFHLASFSNLHHLPFTLSGQKLLHSRSCRVPTTPPHSANLGIPVIQDFYSIQ